LLQCYKENRLEECISILNALLTSLPEKLKSNYYTTLGVLHFQSQNYQQAAVCLT
jgi:hypothetical protein